eukprot:SAG31_NODE_46722_length_253_cov_0.675325_1_plen_40_part_01
MHAGARLPNQQDVVVLAALAALMALKVAAARPKGSSCSAG